MVDVSTIESEGVKYNLLRRSASPGTFEHNNPVDWAAHRSGSSIRGSLPMAVRNTLALTPPSDADPKRVAELTGKTGTMMSERRELTPEVRGEICRLHSGESTKPGYVGGGGSKEKLKWTITDLASTFHLSPREVTDILADNGNVDLGQVSHKSLRVARLSPDRNREPPRRRELTKEEEDHIWKLYCVRKLDINESGHRFHAHLSHTHNKQYTVMEIADMMGVAPDAVLLVVEMRLRVANSIGNEMVTISSPPRVSIEQSPRFPDPPEEYQDRPHAYQPVTQLGDSITGGHNMVFVDGSTFSTGARSALVGYGTDAGFRPYTQGIANLDKKYHKGVVRTERRFKNLVEDSSPGPVYMAEGPRKILGGKMPRASRFEKLVFEKPLPDVQFSSTWQWKKKSEEPEGKQTFCKFGGKRPRLTDTEEQGIWDEYNAIHDAAVAEAAAKREKAFSRMDLKPSSDAAHNDTRDKNAITWNLVYQAKKFGLPPSTLDQVIRKGKKLGILRRATTSEKSGRDSAGLVHQTSKTMGPILRESAATPGPNDGRRGLTPGPLNQTRASTRQSTRTDSPPPRPKPKKEAVQEVTPGPGHFLKPVFTPGYPRFSIARRVKEQRSTTPGPGAYDLRKYKTTGKPKASTFARVPHDISFMTPCKFSPGPALYGPQITPD